MQSCQFKYSNRKEREKIILKVDNLFFSCSQPPAELSLHFSAEQKPPFENPRSATVTATTYGETVQKWYPVNPNKII